MPNNLEFPSSSLRLDNKMNSKNIKPIQQQFNQPFQISPNTQNKHNNIYESRPSLISSKMAFKYWKLIDNEKYNQKLKIEDRLFDEVYWIEEEFNNIYVRFMRFLLEKFNNLMNNTPLENLFLCVSIL